MANQKLNHRDPKLNEPAMAKDSSTEELAVGLNPRMWHNSGKSCG